MRYVADVHADLVCGHHVVEPGLSKAKGEAALERMKLSAFCMRCESFIETKHAYIQTRTEF